MEYNNIDDEPTNDIKHTLIHYNIILKNMTQDK
jgi:hypothetical protein